MNQDKRNRRYLNKIRKQDQGENYKPMTNEEFRSSTEHNKPLPVGVENVKRCASILKCKINKSWLAKGVIIALLAALIIWLIGFLFQCILS